MKTLIISILVLLASTTYKNYSGEWSYEGKNSSFSLTLQQKDSIVTGCHFAVMQNGNKIDGSDEEQTVRGTIEDDQLFLFIKSTYKL